MATLDNATLCNTMKELAREHPRFRSESDFRNALCMKIQNEFPNAEIRFECPASLEGEDIRIDIIVNLGGALVPIELKWKLKSHQAETENRKRMLGDIDRLARLRLEHLKDLNFVKKPHTIQNRFVIWLSDNDRFWNEEGKNKILDHKGNEITWEPYGGDGNFRFALIEAAE